MDPKPLCACLLVFIALVSPSLQVVSSCCRGLAEPCKRKCEQLSRDILSTQPETGERKNLAENIAEICPSSWISIWSCLNSSYEVSASGLWLGRKCCSLSRIPDCQTSCFTAKELSDLTPACRHSDNAELFQCINTIQVGEACCANATISQCKRNCISLFTAGATSSSVPNSSLRQAVISSCSSNSPQVLSCSSAYLKQDKASSPQKSLHCCSKGVSERCRNACVQALRYKVTQQDIIDTISAGCDVPFSAKSQEEALWGCFLQSNAAKADVSSSPSDNAIKAKAVKKARTPLPTYQCNSSQDSRLVNTPNLGLDAAQLSCCIRAASSGCKTLCQRVFSQDWSERKQLDLQCLEDPLESQLATCIEEVENPCETGCSNVTFCSSFNDRSTELFRSCNRDSDIAAEQIYQQWLREQQVVVKGFTILLRDSSQCDLDYLKALACTLQFKPCKGSSTSIPICRNDCFKLLSECMLEPNAPLILKLCSTLTPAESNSDGQTCIQLKDYLEGSEESIRLKSPCKNQPCGKGLVCAVDPNSIEGYTCGQGCKVGDVSNIHVHPGTWIQLPISSSDMQTNQYCHQIYHCSRSGTFDECNSVPCLPMEPCWIDNQRIEHGGIYKKDCNTCICEHGELTCTSLSCNAVPDSVNGILSCGCPLLYAHPVCGPPRKRYLNSCIANCHHAQTATSNNTIPCDHASGFKGKLFTSDCILVIRLKYSQKKVDRLQRAAGNQTVFSSLIIEKALQRLLTFLHCRLAVFDGVGRELFVFIYSNHHCGSCLAEAQKLNHLFRTRSPRLILDASLSTILSADVIYVRNPDVTTVTHAYSKSSTSHLKSHSYVKIFIPLLLLFLMHEKQ